MVTNEHKILQKIDSKEALVDVKMLIANQKIKSFSKGEFIDQDINVEMNGIYFEYRKEYIEFFIVFFETRTK